MINCKWPADMRQCTRGMPHKSTPRTSSMIRKCRGAGLLTHEQRLGVRTVLHHHLVRQHVLVLLLHDVPCTRGGVEAHILQAFIDLCACQTSAMLWQYCWFIARQILLLGGCHGTEITEVGDAGMRIQA